MFVGNALEGKIVELHFKVKVVDLNNRSVRGYVSYCQYTCFTTEAQIPNGGVMMVECQVHRFPQSSDSLIYISKMIDGDSEASDPEQDAGGPSKPALASIKMIDGDAEASYSEEEDYDSAAPTVVRIVSPRNPGARIIRVGASRPLLCLSFRVDTVTEESGTAASTLHPEILEVPGTSEYFIMFSWHQFYPSMHKYVPRRCFPSNWIARQAGFRSICMRMSAADLLEWTNLKLQVNRTLHVDIK
ncbi:hypothetical protein B0H14DRAFT_2630465 [Mycena olivaceomarginata]|nr:hypothetical protein B0H14DRAFT_2630465 [Mycena olivaceomarginata]